MEAPGLVVRVEEAGLGPDAQVRVVVSGSLDLERLHHAWSPSGAAVQPVGGRLWATTTVPALVRAVGRAFGAAQARRVESQLDVAITAWPGPPPPLPLPTGVLATDVRPLVMGVVNVTPDSFSDGGRLYPRDHPTAAVAAVRGLVDRGADVVDIGGESTRPGADPVSVDEELHRVLPVVEAGVGTGAVVSIDTTKPEVAGPALDAGARIVNDVSGARVPALLAVAAERRAGYVLMHARATPRDMDAHTDYDDVVSEVYEFLAEGLSRCVAAGIDPERILVDPGIGFAKRGEHNLALLRRLRQLRGLGRPVLVGASRKRFLGEVLDGAPEGDRLEASLACAVLAVAEGAAMVRAHDVAETVRVARVARAVSTGAADWPPGSR